MEAKRLEMVLGVGLMMMMMMSSFLFFRFRLVIHKADNRCNDRVKLSLLKSSFFSISFE